MLVVSGTILAQEAPLSGRIIDEAGNPIAGAKVTLGNQNISTTTNANGEYQFYLIEAGDEELIVEADGYISDIQLVSLTEGNNAVEPMKLHQDIATQAKEEILLNLSDSEMSDDEGKGQEQSSAASSSVDEFNKLTSYAWSSARYRNRGYSQNYESNYIMGINFMSAERGSFNFSAMGGLNDASRYKETTQGIEANDFSFGGLGNSTNYLMNAYRYAQGWKVGLAGTNRNYKAAVRATYASGVLPSGWAFVGQVAFRFSPYCQQKGIIGEGSDYYSLGLFFSAEKRWQLDKHTLNIIAFANTTQRGQNSALTQELVDLTGSINYNPYWGYQDGRMRNSRIIKSADPTALVTYEFKPNNRHKLRVGVAGHYSLYSNSAINFYNAPDPRPDYYRNLPSFLWDGQIVYSGSDQLYHRYGPGADGAHFDWGNFIGADMNGQALGNGFVGADGNVIGPSIDQKVYNTLANQWMNRNNTTTQLNWDAMYAANIANNANHPNGCARYIQERRHNDIWEVAGNANYTYTGHDHLKLTVAYEGKFSQGVHYKTVDDLLGANQWIDEDPFADRDIAELANNLGLTQQEIQVIKQNNLSEGYNKVKHTGDRFGYDYSMNMQNHSIWLQNEWNLNEIDLYYAIRGTYSSMQRNTSMINGRSIYLCQLAFAQNGYGNMAAVEDACRKYLGPDYDHMKINYQNGAIMTDGRSSWRGNMHEFVDPAFKFGFNYKINGRNHIKFNALAQTSSPLARVAYISPRIHDRVIENIYKHDNASNLKDYYAASEKNVGGDITYEFNYPIVRGRVTAYYTRFWNGTELNGYYDDEAQTFVNQVLTGLNRRHCGIEAAASVKMGTYLTLSGAVAIGDYRYTSDALAVTSAENGMELAEDINGRPVFELRDSVYMKGVRVSNGPQVNSSLKLSFFHPKMWFADITLSYFDWNYLNVAPSRRMYGLYSGHRAGEDPENATIVDGGYYRTVAGTEAGTALQYDEAGEMLRDGNGKPVLGYPFNIMDQQESLVATNPLNRFMLDVSVGKLIYLKNRQSLSINLSVSNLTNNTKFKTGGYQQARLPRATKQGAGDSENSYVTANAWKFPSKYYYAWGANFYLTVTYKF